MSPELGFALLLTLLWGPTALWLIARVVRGQRGRFTGSFTSESAAVQGSEAMPHRLDALASQGFWSCSACHSMNRPGAKRCYSCGREIHAEGRRAPETTPAAAPEAAPAAMPVAARVTAAVTAPQAAPVTRELVPVMAESPARSGGAAARTNVVLAPPPAGRAKAAEPTAEPTAEPAPHDRRRKAAVPALAVLPADPVCPFLGFSDDPTTRCSFPDPRNRCHTPAQPGNDPAAFPLRLITGKAGTMRTLEIGPEHQGALCLTASHEQCARFPAVRVLAGGR